MEETAALSEVHKRVLCILGRGLELWVQIRCLSKNTKKTLALFSLSLLFLISLPPHRSTFTFAHYSHKGDIWERK